MSELEPKPHLPTKVRERALGLEDCPYCDWSAADPLLEAAVCLLLFLFYREISIYQVMCTETGSVLAIAASGQLGAERSSQNRPCCGGGEVTVLIELLYRYFFRSCFTLNCALPVVRCSWNKNVNLDFSVTTSINTSCRIRSVFILEQTVFAFGVSDSIQMLLFVWGSKPGF